MKHYMVDGHISHNGNLICLKQTLVNTNTEHAELAAKIAKIVPLIHVLSEHNLDECDYDIEQLNNLLSHDKNSLPTPFEHVYYQLSATLLSPDEVEKLGAVAVHTQSIERLNAYYVLAWFFGLVKHVLKYNDGDDLTLSDDVLKENEPFYTTFNIMRHLIKETVFDVWEEETFRLFMEAAEKEQISYSV